jgi:hypothetical protein
MGKSKEQHYVPKFYLRNFSIDESRKNISLYNRRTSKYIPSAPIKGQGKDDYTYGKDGTVENDLQTFDDAVADLLSNPISKIIPPNNSDDFNLLKEFVLVQHFRTLKAGAELLDRLNAGIKAVNPLLPPDQRLPPGSTITHDFPTLVSLQNALEHLPLMNYLIPISFVNLTDYPFITSDHPVIFYNQWMESKGVYLGATGLAVKGLQIFLPVHPRLIYCLYDPFVYEVIPKNAAAIRIESDDIVLHLNQLQYLFSDEHLYFDGSFTEQYFTDLVSTSKHLRPRSLAVSVVLPANTPDEKNLLLNSSVDPHNKLQLPFFQFTEESREHELPNGLPLLRHPSFENLKRKAK